MRVMRDSPEYFPPAGEAPPAAPVMAAAALQKFIDHHDLIFQDYARTRIGTSRRMIDSPGTAASPSESLPRRL